MSNLYDLHLIENGYVFTTDSGSTYFVYFLETAVPDEEGNIHKFLNLGFSRNGEHGCIPFAFKYDIKIHQTIIHIIDEVFRKHDHSVMIYFCFGDDGYSRHRKITFNKWKKELSNSVEHHSATIPYEDIEIFSCLMLVNDNPLKGLILKAFKAYLKDFEQ